VSAKAGNGRGYSLFAQGVILQERPSRCSIGHLLNPAGGEGSTPHQVFIMIILTTYLCDDLQSPY
jgi:hypothetical protein